MERTLIVTSPQAIETAVDIVHDCEFDRKDIKFDPNLFMLTMSFYREGWDEKKLEKKILFLKKYRVPVVKYILRIMNVRNYKIVEGTKQGPGTTDFINTLYYDSQKHLMQIATQIAKGVEVTVTELNLSIENTHEIVEEKTKFSLF